MDRPECPRIVLAALLLTTGGCRDEASPASDAAGEGSAATPTPSEAAAEAGAEAGAGVGAKADPATKDVPPSGHAVARIGALLFNSSTGQVGFEIPPLGTGATAPAGITVNVVGEKDGRLEVETLVAQPSEHHCAGVLGGLADFRLRLYISEDDLLRVVAREVSQTFEDGTALRLAPGVPAPEGGSLLAGGTAIEVTLPEGSLGRYYEPGQPYPESASEDPLYQRDGATLAYDGGKVLAEDSLYRRGDGLARFGTVNEASGALVTVRNPCLEVTARTTNERANTKIASPEDMARAAEPGGVTSSAGGSDEDVWGGLTGTEIGEAYGVGGLGLVGTGSGAGGSATAEVLYTVKAGAAIVWADGTPAGQVTSDHTFEAEPREQAGNTCFSVAIAGESSPTVELCFAPGSLTRVERPGTIGLGSTGLLGMGATEGSGGETGFGGLGGSKGVPRVRQAKPAVKGALDKDIIRRIVRAHINEVRYCYNQGLVRDPGLKGRVAIQFTIGPTGSVPVAVVQSSTVSDKNVANCIAKAVKRWKFPKPPGGGNAVVTYPFVLEPG